MRKHTNEPDANDLRSTELGNKRQVAGVLMSRTGCMAYKADVLSPYGVERIRDLNSEQLDDLITRLRAVEANQQTSAADLRKARSEVLYLLGDLGVKARGDDWAQVNQTLLNPKVSGKLLYEMSWQECKDTSKRLRAMINKRKVKQQEQEFKAINN